MKKANRTLALLVCAICFTFMMLTVTTPQAAAAGNVSRKSQVFSYLTQKLGFNSAAACGIMANMEHESEFNPALVIIDCNGLPSGGLCQWNGGRFRNLMNFCSRNGYDYLSIPGQLEYLRHELKNGSYQHIYNHMKNVPNTANGAYDAAYFWCYYFEVPSNRARKAAGRAASAVNSYWPQYCVNNISAVSPVSKADDQTLDLDDSITVSWSKASGNFTGYLAQLAKKTGDDFDWDNARTFSLDCDETALTLKLKELGLGRFAVRVRAYNAGNGFQGGCDNTVKFNADCLEHRMALTERTEPTFKSFGMKLRTCKKCGKQEKTLLKKLTQDDFEAAQIRDFDVTARTANTIDLSWKALTGAQGYRIYRLENGEWVKLRRMEADELNCTVKNLKSGTNYTFRVAAYVKKGEDAVYCQGSTLSVFTRPEGVKLLDIESGQNEVWLQWSAGKRADGYAVFVAETPDGDFTQAALTDADTTQTFLKALKSGVRYSFYVRAYIISAKGNRVYSDPSNTLSVVVR